MKTRWLVCGSVMMLSVACGGADASEAPGESALPAGQPAPAGESAPAPAPSEQEPAAQEPAAPAPEAPFTAPTVAQVLPADGTVGVLLKPTVSITFSQPMDRASTENAFSIGGAMLMPVGALAWSDNDKVLTFTAPSSFANGLDVAVKVAATAKDKEGHTMAAPFASTFRTLRKTIVDLNPTSVVQCSTSGFSIYVNQFQIGDDAANKEYRAFASFDLASIPEDLTSLDDAKITLSGATSVGAGLAGVNAESITPGASVDCSTDFAKPIRTWQNPFTKLMVPVRSSFADQGAGTYTSGAMLLLIADWADRVALGKKALYRLQASAVPAANGASDAIKFDGAIMPNRPKLTVTYTHP